MPRHALLSASSSGRWIECPPSARLCATVEEKGSEYAQQGTEAHALCQYKVERALGHKLANPVKTFTYYDEEMERCTQEYADYIIGLVGQIKLTCKDPLVLVEQHLNFSKYVKEGFGTGDCVIVADNVLTIVDMKYGMGILVSSERNTQLMCYALGALELFDGIYDINTINMTIYQPRRENVSTYTLSKKKLLDWAEMVLKPMAGLAFEGKGEFKAGDHCQFCKVKATCRKRAEFNLELAKYDFQMPAVLKDEEIEAVLSKIESLASWAADVKEFALRAAINGKSWANFKLVEGKSNRKYINDEAVAEAVTKAGYDPYEQKLRGITAMTKLLGKKFDEILGTLVEKPQGKPTLVPMSDKRPAMNNAKQDFSEN